MIIIDICVDKATQKNDKGVVVGVNDSVVVVGNDNGMASAMMVWCQE